MQQTRMWLAGLFLICLTIPAFGQLTDMQFRYRVAFRVPDDKQRDFSDERAAVRRDGKWGYIDTPFSPEIRPMDKVSMCRISGEKTGINKVL
jgi:hypothetical protein